MKGNILDWLAGYKTYILGVATIFYGVGGFFTGHVTQSDAIIAVMTGLGLITGRRAVDRP